MPNGTSPLRIGRQTPTASFTLPYTETRGPDAVEIYQKSGRTALDWQQLIIYDILATDDSGLWVHMTYGLEVPRQNGKNEIIIMRELYGLEHGERILHTAHRTMTSNSSFNRLMTVLGECGYVEKVDFKVRRQYGLEEIIFLKDNGGRIAFRTRSAKGGLGESYDLLVIDEAQEYTPDQQSALQYTIAASLNPQVIMTGTPPTLESSGTIFPMVRESCLNGGEELTGWAEWSIDTITDPKDRDAWYETNPSLGSLLPERNIVSEMGKQDKLDFNIQRLGHWLRYNQKSAISKGDWEVLQLERVPKAQPHLFAGVKFGIDGANAVLSVCAKTTDDKAFIEVIGCRPIREGNEWITTWIMKMQPDKVIIDGANGADRLRTSLIDARYKSQRIEIVSTADVIDANAAFEAAVFDRSVRHMGQPSLAAVATNCEHRPIGSKGGFGYRALKDKSEIGLLDSCVLAYWGAIRYKEKTAQKVYY